MEKKIEREEGLTEEMIDATLADSFPASDPPSWTTGRERHVKSDSPAKGKSPDSASQEPRRGTKSRTARALPDK
jgi:hypothetical protein